jgi:hypothetical protein
VRHKVLLAILTMMAIINPAFSANPFDQVQQVQSQKEHSKAVHRPREAA